MSYQTTKPRTIYVLPPRRVITNSTTNGQQQQQQPQKWQPKPSTTYRLIRPSYTLPPVPAPLVKIAPKPVQCLKRPNDYVINELLGEPNGPSAPRKRERLTHLTAEEKMDRRKMKNRVAAQNARDKKKERSQKMEDVMKNIVDENRRLRQENLRLRQQIEELKLNASSSSSISANTSRLDESLESAAFINAPLLRVQARRLEENGTKKSKNSGVVLTIQLIVLIVQLLAKHQRMRSEEKEEELKEKKKARWSLEMNLKLRKSLKILRALTSTSTDCAAICRNIIKKTLPQHHHRHLSKILQLKTSKLRNFRAP